MASWCWKSPSVRRASVRRAKLESGYWLASPERRAWATARLYRISAPLPGERSQLCPHAAAAHPLCEPAPPSHLFAASPAPPEAQELPPSPPAAGLVSPQVGFQDAVQALVERPGSVIPGPVVVLPVRVGEEIPAQHGEAWRPGPRLHPCPLVQSVEIVREGAELGLWGPQNPASVSSESAGNHGRCCSRGSGAGILPVQGRRHPTQTLGEPGEEFQPTRETAPQCQNRALRWGRRG